VMSVRAAASQPIRSPVAIGHGPAAAFGPKAPGEGLGLR